MPDQEHPEHSEHGQEDDPEHDQAGLTFYPFAAFAGSPTFNAWARLTCHTIQHALRAHPAFPSRLLADGDGDGSGSGGLLLFYLNHPIQYVQVTGVVVAMDAYSHGSATTTTTTVLTLDDGSGATVEAVWRQRPGGGASADDTAVRGLLASVQIGSLVRAKGTLGRFRGRMQVQLLGGEAVDGTAAEMHLVRARARFYAAVLSRPWHLSAASLDRAGAAAADHDTARRQQRRSQARAERERRHADRVMRQWVRDEALRAAEADRARKAGQELHKAREDTSTT